MKKLQKEKGSALIIVTIIVGLLFVFSSVLLLTISQNNHYVSSQEKMSKSYYISEAGIVEGIEYTLNHLSLPTQTDHTISLPSDKCISHKNKKCKEEDVENKTTPHSNGKGLAKGRCKGKGKSTIKNPHCKLSEEKKGYEESGQEVNYDIQYKSNHPIFTEEYKNKAYVKWELKGSVKENIFYITSEGKYKNAITTLECVFKITSDNQIEIIYLIEI